MCLKLLLTDDTTGCLYRIVEKPDLNSVFNTFDIFSFDIFSFGQFYNNRGILVSLNINYISYNTL